MQRRGIGVKISPGGIRLGMATARECETKIDPLPVLQPGELIGPGLCRVVCGCCAYPQTLDARELDRAVHEARRALKRARAVLRMGETMGVAGAKAARRRLARIARELSARRDALVAAKIARRLGAEPAAQKPAPTRKNRTAVAAWWARWQRKLAREERRLSALDWGEPAPAAVHCALAHAARRVRQRAKATRARDDMTSAHEWRKAIVVLYEQMIVVRELLRARMERLPERLHVLGRQLGHAMDFHVLVKASRRRAGLRARGREERRRSIRQARRQWPELRRELRRRLAR